MKKPSTPRPSSSRADIARLEDIQNVGPAVAAYLRRLGIMSPAELLGRILRLELLQERFARPNMVRSEIIRNEGNNVTSILQRRDFLKLSGAVAASALTVTPDASCAHAGVAAVVMPWLRK